MIADFLKIFSFGGT